MTKTQQGFTNSLLDWGPPRYLVWFEMLAGLLVAGFAAFPPVPGSNRAVDAGLCAGFAALAVATEVAGRITRRSVVVDVSVLVASVLLAGFSAASITPQRETLSAILVVSLGILAGYYRSGPRLWLLLAWMLGCYAMVLQVSSRLPSEIYFAFAAVITVALSLMVSRLVAAISALATHDPLTGTLNRTGLVLAAEPLAAVAARSHEPVTVGVVDLDGFKGFNDHFGHVAGDELLVTLTTSWRSVLRSGDLLARIGGDEFVLVLSDASEAEAEALAVRMRAGHAAPWSVGFCPWVPGQDLFAAVKVADDRMYAAKQARSGR
jgi:diguanylate cyclase (GGDEF)-like protein